jgi:hypothetical protein
LEEGKVEEEGGIKQSRQGSACVREARRQGAALLVPGKKGKRLDGLVPGREDRAWADFFIFLLFLFLSLILFKPLENKLEFETKVERSDRSSFNIISLSETKTKNILNIPKLFLS